MWALAPLAELLLVLSVRPMVYLFDRDLRWPRAIRRVFAVLEPFHLVNGYGLFAVMTTRRPEIIVEGSNDGSTWQAYEFKWKPGDPRRRPRYCMPHQPRLEWEVWFAALGDYRTNPWFIATTFDAYFGFLWFWAWIAYKETSNLARGAWLVAVLLLGNIAMATYMLLQLRKLAPGAPAQALLLRT